MNAAIDLAVAKPVYAFLREYLDTHRHAPDARTVYEALGVTKRQYIRCLRWLVAWGFLQHDTGAAWKYVTLGVHHCAVCGTEITPHNALFIKTRKVYLRRQCRACRTTRQLAWRARHPGYDAAFMRRYRHQQKGASA